MNYDKIWDDEFLQAVLLLWTKRPNFILFTLIDQPVVFHSVMDQYGAKFHNMIQQRIVENIKLSVVFEIRLVKNLSGSRDLL